MKKILYVTLLQASLLCFSQSKDNGVAFINSLLKNNNYEKSYTFFDESIKTQITQKLLQETSEQIQTQLGQFKNIIETNNEQKTYFYYADFENMKLDIKISFNDNNKIIGFFFVPHKEFIQTIRLGKDLNITSNNIQLKGTILVPENDNIKKLVIYVHGSGPNDRDETMLENKPFRDIVES